MTGPWIISLGVLGFLVAASGCTIQDVTYGEDIHTRPVADLEPGVSTAADILRHQSVTRVALHQCAPGGGIEIAGHQRQALGEIVSDSHQPRPHVAPRKPNRQKPLRGTRQYPPWSAGQSCGPPLHP